MISEKLCVFSGGSFQVSFGERSGPSQLNFFGMVSPAGKAVLEICRDMVPPIPCPSSFPGGDSSVPSRAQVMTEIFTSIGSSTNYGLSGGAAAAKKLRHLGMLARFGKGQRRLAVGALLMQVRAMLQQHLHDFQMAIRRRLEQWRMPRTIAVVRVGAILQQPGGHLRVTAGHGPGQRVVSRSSRGRSLHSCALGEQIFSHVVMPKSRRQREDRKSVR